MNEYNSYGQYLDPNSQQSLTNVVSSTMKRVYIKMMLALIVTGIVAWLCAGSQAYMTYIMTHSWPMWVLFGGTFLFVIVIGSALQRMSSATCTLLFYVFAIMMGAMMSTIFIAYKLPVIAKTFFITAGTFGAMSIYGYTTKTDLTKYGTFFMMALFGLIIAMVVNIFLRSSGLEWAISIIGVFIFVGLTAWDTQQIKIIAAATPAEYRGKLATMGALNLYLDFINLFLFLLRIFGNRD